MRKKKVKILYTIPNFNTAGSGKALLNVVSRMDKDLFEPNICCKHDRGDMFRTVKELGIPIHIFLYTALMKPRLEGIKNVLKISKFFKEINSDLIHSYNYSDDYSEPLAAKLSRVKWIYTKKNMGWGGNAWKLRTRLADAIIPQNQEMIETFFKGSNKLSLIPIGIDVKEFNSLKKNKELINFYNFNDSYPIILTIGSLIPIKGVDFLIEGFNIISKTYPKSKLIIVGEDKTEFAQEIKKLVSELKLNDKIIFTGKQNDTKPFFSVSDIFILSSRKEGEGGPISILEAMASDVFTLGSNVPGIRDQFKEFPDQLFKAESREALANRIFCAIEMSCEEREKKIIKQKEFIQKNYSIENEVNRLQELYLKLLN